MKTTTLTKAQKKTFRKDYTANGKPETIIAEVRHDDQCGNGHNTFSITGTIYTTDRQPGEETVTHRNGKTLWSNCGGCIHDEIAKHFPELAPLIKWHLTSTDRPIHYVSNAVYHAGDRDCWGLRKGEFRQHKSRGPNQNNGIEGVPNWTLEIPERQARDVYANEKPAPVVCEWKAYGRTGDGKERELDAARRVAIWTEATDADLMQEPEALKAALLARMPALMAEFQAAVESLGFIY